jgi:hypothetical protein
MKLRTSKVTGHVGGPGTISYVPANGSRVGIEFGASYSGGYCYAEIYVDSVISSNLIGSVSWTSYNQMNLYAEDFGDLVQRRFAILKGPTSGATAVVGVTEVFESEVSGG